MMAINFVSMAARVAGFQEESQQEKTGYVKHIRGKGYCVKSPNNPSWNGGCYKTKGEAEKRLHQVEYFKHMKK